MSESLSISRGSSNSLTKDQKEAVGLLSIGTFLEYFDLMLYVHMAVLLNELFFPKTDPFTASILSAFTFCTTFVFRPIGAMIFGYFGDKFGRKSTVIVTTFIMASCSFVMAFLPTYKEIGITASVIMILCRVVQGMAAMGEGIGAEIYLTESIRPPMQYPCVALVSVGSVLGGTVALAVCSMIISLGINWRYAFGVGCIVAFVGSIARTTLKETADFADAKKALRNIIKQNNDGDDEILNQNAIVNNEKGGMVTAVYFFMIQCLCPITFYFVYVYCGSVLKDSFGYTSEEVITHNLVISLSHLCLTFFITYLSYKIYPLRILKFNFVIAACLFLACPFLLKIISSPIQLFIIQFLLKTSASGEFPAAPIFYKNFPVFKRFTYSCMTYALGRGIMFAVTSFGLVYLIEYFGNYGMLFVFVPVLIGYKLGLSHFENLEREKALPYI